MKLVTFRSGDDVDRVGVLREDAATLVDLSSAFPSMLALIDGGPEALSRAREAMGSSTRVLPLTSVNLRAPLPEPRQMRDCLVFEKHLRQATDGMIRLRTGALARLATPVLKAVGVARVPSVWYEQPIYYKCNRFSVVGPGADVVWPRYAKLMDFECEVAIVVGKRGKDIAPARAREHIFGYCIYNDMSARDAQAREMDGRLGPAKGKDFDTGNVLGPWLVTADEIADPYALTMVARVNGEEWGRGSSGAMHHRWESILAHISQDETLYPGEVIGSGTVGDGCGLEQSRFLKAGDAVELAITGLGILRNRLVMPRRLGADSEDHEATVGRS